MYTMCKIKVTWRYISEINTGDNDRQEKIKELCNLPKCINEPKVTTSSKNVE